MTPLIFDLQTIRHSCSHIMAQAVKELWPDVKVAIGPAIDDGFYYDFDKKEPFLDEDLKLIEKAMQKIINKNLPIVQSFMKKAEAIKFFNAQGEKYKVELVENLEDENVSIYTTGDNAFVDLCKGPHVSYTGEIKAFKLLSVAGAYWRGDEKRESLQRIYGTCFATKEELQKYLTVLEEAKKRDHRVLGKQLDLFNFYHETAGGGLVFYHTNGAIVRKIIEDYIYAQNIRRGYQPVITPHVLKGKLWQQSGHMGYYRDNMYFLEIDNEEFAVKPMNCPGHMLIYNSSMHSYREMPLRMAELGTVYRYEKAGVLHGLLRVRGFTQDDAHIFCREDQVKEEIKGVIDYVFDVMKDFGFKNIDIELSTRPEKFIGKVDNWDLATQALQEALKEKNLVYTVHEGEGAFYGPKIDFKLRDALNRLWQCSTIQCDFALPERFDLKYIAEDGTAKRPIMIHRAIFGSIERFFGTLIEHYGGAFPSWLAPVQVAIIPIKDTHYNYAIKIKQDLQNNNVRVIMDDRNESLNKRIRENTVKKIPYILVVGDKEAQEQTVAVRKYSAQGEQKIISFEQFIQDLDQEIKNKQF
ncbi:MAG TPA: threonine--tRNA ligase [Candidatus Omnitrophota bacterium]|nr:threonine--tRNA ligase [Candidatus Omnitrophota bacterium]HPN87941.1 threonine--tRNA ligase [Candidatus Omnitrophota bacterium]